MSEIGGSIFLIRAISNQVPESELGPGNAQLNQPYPQYLGVNASFFDGISNYKRSANQCEEAKCHTGLLLTANYTWSKTMDEITNSGFVGGGGGHAEHGGALPKPIRSEIELRSSTTDFRHFFNGSLVYETPFGERQALSERARPVGTRFIGGWEISSLFQIHSGSPFTPYVGSANESGSAGGGLASEPHRIRNRCAPPIYYEWFDPECHSFCRTRIPSEIPDGISVRSHAGLTSMGHCLRIFPSGDLVNRESCTSR